MGGPSCPKSYSCSRPHPRPRTPLPVLCLFQGARCGSRDGAGRLEPPEARWEQRSWNGLGLGWGEGTCKSSLLSLGTLPARAWWGLLGGSRGAPEPGVQLPPPHPTLSLPSLLPALTHSI